MTAIAAAPARTTKTRAAFRLMFANPKTTFLIPAMILAAILLVNAAIWFVIDTAVPNGADRADAQDGIQYSGAAAYLFIYIMVVAVQSITVSLPFALGYGITRKHFYRGSVLGFLALSGIWAAVMTILALIEEVTGGWGLNGTMFTAVYFGDGPWFARFVVYFALFLLFGSIGVLFASVWQRFRRNGVLLLSIGSALLVVGLVALFTYTRTWHVLWGGFGAIYDVGGTTLIAASSLVLSTALGLVSWAVLRRVTPVG
jgi:hypothetical protein